MTDDKATELINEWLSRGSYEQEMDETARKYKELTGKDLSDFFRKSVQKQMDRIEKMRFLSIF